jgi:hypothetical protein
MLTDLGREQGQHKTYDHCLLIQRPAIRTNLPFDAAVLCGSQNDVSCLAFTNRSKQMTIDWSDPAPRNRLIERVGPDEYNRLHAEQMARSTLAGIARLNYANLNMRKGRGRAVPALPLPSEEPCEACVGHIVGRSPSASRRLRQASPRRTSPHRSLRLSVPVSLTDR